MRGIKLGIVLGVVATALVPAAAQAASVQLVTLPETGYPYDPVTWVRYVASPGEKNDPKISLIRDVEGAMSVSVIDKDLPIHWTRAADDPPGVCVPGVGRAICVSPDWVSYGDSQPPVDVHLGDGDDHIVMAYDGRADGGPGSDVMSTRGGDIYGGEGADVLTGSSYFGTEAHGGPGNDVLTAPDAYYGATLYGDEGDDRFLGAVQANPYEGASEVHGGPGADVGVLRGAGMWFDGGPGPDEVSGPGELNIDYTSRTAGITVTLDGLANDGEPGEGDNVPAGATVFGGDGNDRIEAGTERMVAVGGDGDDTLIGGPGNDGLSGGDGNNHMEGGAGDDTFSARDGNDYFDGGTGKDWVNSSLGDDEVHLVDGERDHASCVASGGQSTTIFADAIDDIFNSTGPCALTIVP